MGFGRLQMEEDLKYIGNFKRTPSLWETIEQNKNEKENSMYYAVKFRGTNKEYFYRSEIKLPVGAECMIECGETSYNNPVVIIRMLAQREAKAQEKLLNAPLRTITAYKITKGIPRPNDRIKKVIFNREKRTTCVLWDDGKKTVVKCAEEDLWDEEKALALCYMKRVLGNRGSFNETLKKWCWRG